ncbi:2OG-Fe(II) oxygenase [bacterium]|nr:MAG: 2OG-Fe(II) oxygenase [bacterium]
MQKHDIVPDRIITIENFLSPQECEAYIRRSEEAGYEQASITTRIGQIMRPDIRNNSRVIMDDPSISEAFWDKVRPFVPSPLFGREAIGLNERWRFYQYEPGQQFKMHQDGSFKRDNGEKSQFTFMIYLNEGAEGGETRFRLNASPEIVTVVPRVGMALLFLHTLMHEGAPVRSGKKYVLRSDVMYSAESK